MVPLIPSDVKRLPALSLSSCRVFGAGYPGLPTMTVDDWYEQRRRQGVVSGQSAPQRMPGTGWQSEGGNREFGKPLEGEGGRGRVQGVNQPLTEEE